MRIAKNLLTSSTLAILLACTAASAGSGCVAHGRARYSGAVVVRSEPPPPRTYYVEPRSGYVWVDGRWVFNDYSGEWVWYDGYWVQDRPGYVYVAGRWDRRHDRYVYVHPRWVSRSNSRAVIRVTDHARPTKVRIRESTGQRVPGRRNR